MTPLCLSPCKNSMYLFKYLMSRFTSENFSWGVGVLSNPTRWKDPMRVLHNICQWCPYIWCLATNGQTDRQSDFRIDCSLQLMIFLCNQYASQQEHKQEKQAQLGVPHSEIQVKLMNQLGPSISGGTLHILCWWEEQSGWVQRTILK